MTPNEITTLFATKFGKELDVPFKKMLYERVKYWRATLIKQSIDKSPLDTKYFRQAIYLPMVKINVLAIAAELTCYNAVTQIEVPLPIRVSDQVFSYVGSLDGMSPFGYADSGMLRYMKAGRYAGRFNYQNYINRKFYIAELPDLPFLRIEGVFNSPEEAMIYETVPPQPDVDWWNRDIPMSGDIEQRVIQCMNKVDYEDPGKEKTDDQQVPVNNEEL